MAKASKKVNQKQVQANQRRAIVFLSLISTLGLTTTLLLAFSPQPLAGGAMTSLFAAGANASLEPIFETERPLNVSAWKQIYVHHSKTLGGDGRSLARLGGDNGLGDHFVICNGDGGTDGELQVGYRWMRQLGAVDPTTGRALDDGTITICLVGDFDDSAPSDAQMRRLGQLLSALSARTGVAAMPLVSSAANSPAGIGRRFPHERLVAALNRGESQALSSVSDR